MPLLQKQQMTIITDPLLYEMTFLGLADYGAIWCPIVHFRTVFLKNIYIEAQVTSKAGFLLGYLHYSCIVRQEVEQNLLQNHIF